MLGQSLRRFSIKPFRATKEIRPIFTNTPPPPAPINSPILSAVCSKPNVEDYTVLVENQTEDFLDSYMKSLTSKDTLLIPSSGRKADMVARKALENGVNFEWRYSPILFPIDPDDISELIWHKSNITHLYVNAAEPFTGVMNPIFSLITKCKKVRPDLNIFVDYSYLYPFYPLEFCSMDVNYVLFNNKFMPSTKQLSFLLARKSHLECLSMSKTPNPLATVYKKEHTLQSLKGPILSEIESALGTFDAPNKLLLYTGLQDNLVNKVFFPPMAAKENRSPFSTCFLFPNRGNGEVIKPKFKELNLNCETRLLPSNMEAISINTQDLFELSIQQKDILDHVATILNQSFKPETATFSIPDTFIDEEQNNRHIRIYGIQ